MKTTSMQFMNPGKAIKSFLAIALCALAALFSETASAAEKFADGATVVIENMPGGPKDNKNPVFVLEKTGEDKTGDGTYRILGKAGNRYLTVMKGDAGTMVGWTSKEGEKGSEWILHQNSGGGFSIIAKANGANCVSRSSKSSSELELQRNEASPNQVWFIKKK